MPYYKYRKTLNTPEYLKVLNSQLPIDEQISGINVARQERISVDAPTGSKDDLDFVLGLLGYESNGAGDDLTPTTHHGKFDVAGAPTTNIEEGDGGYCTDGNLGVGAPVYYDGSDWKVVSTDNVISAASTGGVTFATVSFGKEGSYTGADGDYTATQASTSGSGAGATFTVTIASGVVTGVVSVDTAGSGYATSDTITLSISGVTEVTAAELTVFGIA